MKNSLHVLARGCTVSSGAYLVQIQHLVPSDAPSGLDIFHGQGEVDPSCIRQVEVIGVVLVPLLHRCEYLLLIGADDVQVLSGSGERLTGV